MAAEFQREYLVRLPLPLAQLYSRSYNAPAPRARHDYSFYLFEALIKLAACPLVAAYLQAAEASGRREAALDRLLAQLALPSLGQWVAMLRELSRYFGQQADAAVHPLGHLWNQLNAPHASRPALLALYRRIKNGPDAAPGGDQSCSLLQLFEALVLYRNTVFGHGAARFESFYDQEMGSLLFPAASELLAENVFDLLGPRDARLVCVGEPRTVEENRVETPLAELVGLQAERAEPLVLTIAEANTLLPGGVAVHWPGQRLPLRLDPLLVFRGGELADEVLMLNRDRNGRQVEYLSYTTGRTERDRTMAPGLVKLLSRITSRPVTEQDLDRLAVQSLVETPSVEALFEPAPAQRTLGDYEILSEIGRGGMGVVYLARQLSLGRLVALKMLPADIAGNEMALARFRREMRALGRCEHPNIVKVLANGAFPDGRLYYAMEYVPGADLELIWRELTGAQRHGGAATLGSTTWSRAVLTASKKLREQVERKASGAQTTHETSPAASTTADTAPSADPPAPVPPLPLPPLPELPSAELDPGGYARRVAQLMRDAALALQAVHDQNIVHRDVKPANLILTPDGGRVVLMDFGLAKGQSVVMTTSVSGGFLGTLRYAAPEQLAAAKVKVGPQADIHALGVTLWELLTRQRAFGDAEDEHQLASWVLSRNLPRLRAIDPTLDLDLEAIVARATDLDPAERIQTARDLAGYLDLYLEGKPLPIRPPGVRELAWRWMRAHTREVAAAAVVLVFLGVVGWFTARYWNRLHEKEIIAEQTTAEAKKEKKLSHEQQLKNQREEKRLQFQTELRSARDAMLDANLANFKNVDRALERFQKSAALAEELSQTENREEHNDWLVKWQNVLLQMSDAYAKKRDQKNVVRVLAEREKLVAQLPENLRASTKANTEFSEYRSTVLHLMVDLAVANDDLVKSLQAQEQERARIAARQNPRRAASPEKPLEARVREANLYINLAVYADLLSSVELVARSTDKREDWDAVIQLLELLAKKLNEDNYREDANRYLRQALALVEQRLAKPQAEMQRGLTKMSLSEKDGQIVIDYVPPWGPANAAGIKANDRLVAVGQGADGPLVETAGKPLAEVQPLVAGKPNTLVRVQMLTPGETAPHMITLTREAAKQEFDEQESKDALKAFSLCFSLGSNLRDDNDYAGAKAVFEQGLALQALIPPAYRDAMLAENVFRMRGNLADMNARLGDPAAAIAGYKTSLTEGAAANQRLADEAVRRAAGFRERAATALARFGDVAAGRSEYEAAVELRRQLVNLDPTPHARKSLADLLVSYGAFLEKNDDAKAGLAATREAAGLYLKLLETAVDQDVFSSLVTANTQTLRLVRKLTPGEADQTAGELTQQFEKLTSAAKDSPSALAASRAARAAGAWYENLGEKEKALAAYAQALTALVQLRHEPGESLEQLVFDYYSQALLYARLGDLAQADAALAEACTLAAQQFTAPPRLADQVWVLLQAGQFVAPRNAAAALARYQAALAVEVPLADNTFILRHGEDLAAVYELLTAALAQAGERTLARTAFERRLELARRLAELNTANAAKERLAQAHVDYGEYLVSLADKPAALAELKQAVDVYATCAAKGSNVFPFSAATAAADRLRTLAAETKNAALQAAATAALVRFLEQTTSDASATQGVIGLPAAAFAWSSVAPWYEKLDRKPEAIAAYAKALDLKEQALRQFHGNLRPLLVEYFNDSAKVEKLGDLATADAFLLKCRQLADETGLSQSEPVMQLWLLVRSALVKELRGDKQGAAEFAQRVFQVELPVQNVAFLRAKANSVLGAYRDATKRLQTAGETDAANAGQKRQVEFARLAATALDDAQSWRRLGDTCRQCDQVDEAIAAYEGMRTAAQKAVDQKADASNHAQLADAYEQLGATLVKRARYADAQAAYEANFKLREQLAAENANDDTARHLARAHGRLAYVAYKQGHAAAAAERVKQAIAVLEPRLGGNEKSPLRSAQADWYNELAWYSLCDRQGSAALAAALKAHELAPDDVSISANLVYAYALADNLPEAQALVAKYHEARINEDKTFLEYVRDDLAELKQRGVTHANFDALEEQLKDVKQAPPTAP